jgi:hypothetical protein
MTSCVAKVILYRVTDAINSWTGHTLFVENEIIYARTGTYSNWLYRLLAIVVLFF